MNKIIFVVFYLLVACAHDKPPVVIPEPEPIVVKPIDNSIRLSDYYFAKKITAKPVVEEETRDEDEEEFEKDVVVAVYNFKNEYEEMFSVGKKAELPDLFIYPLKQKGSLTSGYGMRNHPLKKKKSFHKGVDIGISHNTNVMASAKGVVIMSKYSKAYGNVVIVAHSHGYSTVYAHNTKNLVQNGQTVKKGQIISLSGNSGDSTGPHLHFEVRRNNIPLEPLSFLKNQKKIINN